MTTPAVTKDEIRRLAFIKYLYRIAMEQSQRPEPMKAAALLTFHDAVELFLYLATQHLGVSEEKMEFAGYFKVLKKALPGGRVAREGKMRSLNDARIGLKHYGNPLSSALIDEFRNDVTTFFEENTPLIFDGREFHEISMVHLVRSQRAQTHLKTADEKAHEGDRASALTEVSIAFSILLDENDERMRRRYGRSPFWFGGHLPIGDPILEGMKGLPRTELQAVRDMVYEARAEVRTLQQTIRVLARGLDYRRYARFSLIAPYVRFLGLPGGNDGYFGELSPEVADTATMDDYRFCFDFVIDSALRLLEFDFDVE